MFKTKRFLLCVSLERRAEEAPKEHPPAWCSLSLQVVGCLLDADAKTARFTINGADLGVAFEDCNPSGADSQAQSKRDDDTAGFFAALSLEDNEAVRVAIHPEAMRHAPPAGYQPINKSQLYHIPLHVAPPKPAKIAAATVDEDVDMTRARDEQNAPKPAAALTKPAPAKKAADPPPHTPPEPAPEPPAKPPPKVKPPPKPPARKSPASHFFINPWSRLFGGLQSFLPLVASDLSQSTPAQLAPEALDLGTIQSLAELEVLGLDRLKTALMAAGCKCGGTLADRANRLWSTKGRTQDQWDPKILAKKHP